MNTTKSKKIKIIMLDIDGVLGRYAADYCTPLMEKGDLIVQTEPELVFMLNKLVDKTGAELVLSSAWRRDPNWRETMAANGIVKKFLDRTPTEIPENMKTVGFGPCRGDYIHLWLQDHPEVEDYVILDDMGMREFLPHQESHLYRTKVHVGLTGDIAVKVIERFNS